MPRKAGKSGSAGGRRKRPCPGRDLAGGLPDVTSGSGGGRWKRTCPTGTSPASYLTLKVAGRWRYLYRAVDQFGQVIDVLVSEQRDTAAAQRFFTQALEHAPAPVEVTTDRAQAYLRVLDELLPAARHVTDQYANNPIECDHGRLKARLRPMRGLKRLRSAAVIVAGHAFVQSRRRGFYELGLQLAPRLRLASAFDELALTICSSVEPRPWHARTPTTQRCRPACREAPGRSDTSAWSKRLATVDGCERPKTLAWTRTSSPTPTPADSSASTPLFQSDAPATSTRQKTPSISVIPRGNCLPSSSVESSEPPRAFCQRPAGWF